MRRQFPPFNTHSFSASKPTTSIQYAKDEEQNEGLIHRSLRGKNDYKYLQMADRAQWMVKQARQINKNRIRYGQNLRRNKVLMDNNEKTLCKQKDKQQEVKQQSRRVQDAQNLSESREISTQVKLIKQSKVSEVVIIQKDQLNQMLEGSVNKSVLNIDHQIVKSYFATKIRLIDSSATPQRIYRVMNSFYQLCGMSVSQPLVKKYKNCTYFGQSNSNPLAKYQGFIIFHQEEKLYYGELHKQKKNGKGIQIDFKNDIIYIGQFERGKKIGNFIVIKKDQKYIGQLQKGLYHGYGELNTQRSSYKGRFAMGQKNGEGQQTFLSLGLTICGKFVNNKFTNKDQNTPNSQLQAIKSNLQNTQIYPQNKQSNANYPNPERSNKSKYKQQKPIFEVYDCSFILETQQNEEGETQRDRNRNFRITERRKGSKSKTQRKLWTSESRQKRWQYSTLNN